MRKSKFIKVLGNIIFYLFLISLLLLSFSLIKGKLQGKQPEILGYKFYGVLTGSMSPTIEPGDLIIVKTIPTGDIKVEDIITFKSEGSNNIITHRVKGVIKGEKLSFITQGDANNVQDPNPIEGSLVQGKVIKNIPNIGSLMKFMQEHIVIIMTILIILIIGGFILVNYFKNNIKK